MSAAYGFPVFDLPPDQKLCLLASMPAVEARQRLIAGNVSIEDAEEMRALVLDLTNSDEAAEAAVLAWRTKRAEQGAEGI